jgi:catechol 2,3-dioxygenase-like lactoylglutathione lyase family enzyme
MEPRISLITLGVADLQRSLRFYRDGLGLPTTWDGSKGVVFFQTRGAAVSLFPLDELAKDIGPAFELALADQRKIRAAAGLTRSEPRFSGITLAHNVRERAEVDAVLAQAVAAGAALVKPAHDTFWGGYSGYFADPDGHLWEVAYGAFPFNDDGSLAIP